MPSRKPYKQRTDLERIESQWRKLDGLHSREEWSAAIVRAATAAEIAANFAIRKEFSARSQFDSKFVDCLLKWANGLSGKVNHILIPLFDRQKKHASLKNLRSIAEQISSVRNDIVHRGMFCNGKEALKVIANAKEFVETLVRFYEPGFTLEQKE